MTTDTKTHRSDLLITDAARAHATGVYEPADTDDVFLCAARTINREPGADEYTIVPFINGLGKRTFVVRPTTGDERALGYKYVILTTEEAAGTTELTAARVQRPNR